MERYGMDFTLGKAAGAERIEPPGAFARHDCLGKDAARRIAGT
jgi:hypothetical protein